MPLTLSENERKLIRGIKRAVEARGRDWTYPERPDFNNDVTNNWYLDGVCVNKQLNGEAACIVGFAAMDAGLRIERDGGVSDFIGLWDLKHDSFVVRALIGAQGRQDHGEGWGVAFDEFEEILLHHMTREELDAIYAESQVKKEATPEEILAALDFVARTITFHPIASCDKALVFTP